MIKKFNKTFFLRTMVAGIILLLRPAGMLYGNPAETAMDKKEHTTVSLPDQERITVRGVVSDHMGTIMGANILEKGTANGTVTDMDGNFTLSVPSNATLVVSYIGYIEQQIPVNGRTAINVLLIEDSQALDEVVVVGYGTQKKVNLSGSVSAISVSELTEGRPITNVSQALAGLAAGVQVTSGSNQPGNDDATIKIRGQGTLNNSSPLVIIDGVEASINSVNPQDIEAMSVLKDAASAAIYGSRAANGVILITTKQGRSGSLKLDYNGYVSFGSIRKTLTPVSNYADYMELINEGRANSGYNDIKFSQASIDAWRNDAGKNPLLYPNTDWIDETFRTATTQNHVVSMSGGSEKIRFYSSFGYQHNPGVMENTGYERFNARLNLDADIKPWLNLGVQLNGYVSNMEPAAKYGTGTTVVDNVFTYASATTPGMVFRAPDGRYGAPNNPEEEIQPATNNPLRRLNSTTGNIRKNNLRSRFVGTLKPFTGFTATASYSYEMTDELRETQPVFIDAWNFQTNTVTSSGTGRSYVTNYNGKVERYFGDIVLRYENRVIDQKLGFNIMAGGSQELYRTKNFSATKYDLIDMGLSVIDGAVGDASASGTSTEWAMHSFFGRINLDWESKYLLELNLRGDGSSRFLSDNRWGYFPSASAAWRLDQEGFMEEIVNKGLSNLKFRVSYGSLGNNDVGNYDALALYTNKDNNSVSLNYVLNNTLAMGLAQAAIANANLTWEVTKLANIGIDFGFMNNRLTGTVDYFNKRTTDILIDLPAPEVHGIASIPTVNSATVTNQGVELTLGWQDKKGDFGYSVNGNLTYVKNKVNKFKGDEYSLSGANLIQEGYSINSQYLLRVDRILQTEEDMKIVQQIIDNAPVIDGEKVNPFAAFGTPQLGDLLYKDINGDGIIDNNDREVVSDGPNPKFFYGFNLGASYKGFDLAVLLQGVAGVKVYWQEAAYNTPTIRVGYQINKEIADGRWVPGRTDAKYPRLLDWQNEINTKISDFYLEDKAYFKIKNIQLGYTLPKSWMGKIQIERIRVYGSLENFFTFTKYKGFDPEVEGLKYPTMKQAVLGLNVAF